MILLLSIVISWGLIRYTHVRDVFVRMDWFERYYQWMLLRTEKWSSRLEVRRAIILILPLLVLGWIFPWIERYPLFRFVMDIIVLLYGMSYQEKEAVVPSSPQARTRCVFSDALSHSFGGVFWFVVLGPWGVLFYEFIRRAHETTVKQLLEWPAARILALGYALAGHFPPTFSYWSLNLLKHFQYNQEFLENCGFCALNANVSPEAAAHPDEAEALVKRAQYMLLIILVILVVGGLLY